MTNQQHPITPPPELFKQWFKQWEDDILNERNSVDNVLDCAWRDGFRAGADQELEACCEWAAEQDRGFDLELRAARRPKLRSLGETALVALETIEDDLMGGDEAHPNDLAAIRRALERLQELEGQGDD